MAKLDRQIEKHNAQMQSLRCCGSYRLRDFLNGASGNFMITGGVKDRRRQVLLRQIEYYRQTSNSSVVIFSDDGVLKNQLINEAQNGILGQLYVFSSEYNNYDFFYQMPFNLVGEYFSRAAQLRKNIDTAKLLTFADVFLNIVASDGIVNMTSMRERLQSTNKDIANASGQDYLRDMILSAQDGGSLLRDLMEATDRAFGPLTTSACSSRSNLTSRLGEDCIVLIDIPKDNHDLYAEYFAMVLRSNMNASFYLVLDDEIMLNNNDFFDVIELLKQRYNVDVIASYENIISMQPDGTDILKNINRQAIFLNGNMPAVDLQTVLSRYGQFTAMEAVEHREVPPSYLFTLLRGTGEAATTYTRDRAMLQNLNAEVVLSRGSNAEILAVRRLIA